MSEYPMQSAMKENKSKGKITSMSIRQLHDGSFMYSCHTDKGVTHDYSYKSPKDLLAALADDLKSPHLREMKDMDKDPKMDKGGDMDKDMEKDMGKMSMMKEMMRRKK